MNSYTPFNHPSFRGSSIAEPRPEIVQRAPARVLTSESLFRGTTEIGIEHHGAMYRLKITRQGKLILNK